MTAPATEHSPPGTVVAARRARASVIATFFVHGLLFASWTAHIPSIKAALGLNDASLGLALLGPPLGSICAMGLASWFVPRLGSRLLVRITLGGYALAGPLVGLAHSAFELSAALFVWGAFQGTLDISMNAQAIAVEQGLGRRLMNTMHACWGLGAFAGAGIGTVGVALGVGLTPQLLVTGLPTAAVALLLTARMLGDRRGPAHPQEGAGAPPVTERPRRRAFPTAVLVLGAIAFASMLCEGAAADWSSVYLRESAAGSAAVAGLGYTVFTLAMVIVRFTGDALLTRFGAAVVIPALAALAAATLAAALAAGGVAFGLVAFFVLGLGLGAVVPGTFSAAGRLADLHPGQAVAYVSGLGWAGFLLGPPIIGQVAGATSLPLALGLVPLLCAFIVLAARRVTAMRG